MKQIYVEHGREFKIKIRDINNSVEAQEIFANDIFSDVYKKAAMRVEDIVTATKNNNDDISYGDYLNNIIAFSGERGQGKSSAMLSFTHYLKNLSNFKDSEIFKENTLNYQFIPLETIDPSTFEDMHNILEVVIARMYNNFAEKYTKDSDSVNIDLKNRIMELFQTVYESLSLIRNPKKLEELEYDYDGSIQKIAHIGDSTNLQKNIRKLVKAYLEIFSSNNNNSFLVIPIDDLDINIKYAYKITEQLRKYLIIPNVLIVMAINIEQLKKCVEKEFREQLYTLIREGNRINKDEPTNMAAKYVEKLIPDGRKITLPEIRVISESGHDDIELIYIDIDINKNLLDKNNRRGLQEALLGYIYDKTEMIFVKPLNGVHIIIPNTLREVVNLLSVLGKMEDLPNSANENIKDKRNIQLENLNIFEDYILNTWIPNNLDNGNIGLIKELLSVNNSEKHRFLCVRIMDIIENTGMYTVDDKIEIKQLESSFEQLREKFSVKNTNCIYSLGDIFDLLNLISKRYINTQIDNLIFAIKTIYTIIMHKIYLRDSDEARMTENLEPNELYKFIGENLWGYGVKNIIRGDRSRFLFNVDKFIGDSFPNTGYYSRSTILDDNDKKKIVDMTIWSNFPRIQISDIRSLLKTKFAFTELERFLYNQELYTINYIADNYLARKIAYFSIDNLFISLLDLEYIKIKSGLSKIACNCDEYIESIRKGTNINLVRKIIINMELCSYLQQYATQKNNFREGASNNEFYFNNLIKRIKDALDKIKYITLIYPKIGIDEGDYNKIFIDDSIESRIRESFASCVTSKISKLADINQEMVDNDDENSSLSEETDISSNLEIKAEEEINEILNGKEKNVKSKIKIDIENSQIATIKNQVINLARIVAYYKNTLQEESFNDIEVGNNLRKLYFKCIVAQEQKNTKDRTAYAIEIRKEYLIVANIIQNKIDKIEQR